MVRDNNHYAERFRRVGELLDANTTLEVKVVIKCGTNRDRRTHNIPVADEIAIILPGDEMAPLEQHKAERNLVLTKTDGKLQYMSMLNAAYDPLIYVIPFPFGEEGWAPGMKYRTAQQIAANSILAAPVVTGGVGQVGLQSVVQPNGQQQAKHGSQGIITVKNFYSYMIMCREGFDAMRLHHCGRLFQQYVVGAYSKMDAQRLIY
jgi:hypothetical protein